ncbi:MAG: isopentenyl-diphosphate Delta-isomerase [archaeon]
MDEIIVVDKDDNIIGVEEKEKCHDGEGILHRAFSIFVFNEMGELLIQQRSGLKKLWPLFWSNSCCSHPRLNEKFKEATEKRLGEELGITCPLKYIYKFRYKAKYTNQSSENEVCSVFIGKLDNGDKINANPEEVSNFKWTGIKELKENIVTNPERYTPWFKAECEELFGKYWSEIDNLFISPN